MGGVAPAVIVVSAARVTRVGMPSVISDRGGMVVPVAATGVPTDEVVVRAACATAVVLDVDDEATAAVVVCTTALVVLVVVVTAAAAVVVVVAAAWVAVVVATVVVGLVTDVVVTVVPAAACLLAMCLRLSFSPLTAPRPRVDRRSRAFNFMTVVKRRVGARRRRCAKA